MKLLYMVVTIFYQTDFRNLPYVFEKILTILTIFDSSDYFVLLIKKTGKQRYQFYSLLA